MRTRILTVTLAALLTSLAAGSAQAAPTTVNVRIEGKEQTLFEGPIESDGHNVKAASDSAERECDGMNAGKHAAPGATPIASAVDAMTIAGQTFDGEWNAGRDDYFITRWGPDAENTLLSEFWGLLVDKTFTSVGGCQYELAPGDQVLWVYNAFKNEPFLTLFAGSETSGAGVATATVALNTPLTATVDRYSSSEGSHGTLKPFEGGAGVALVNTDKTNGFETIGSTVATTGPTGTASIEFSVPGWYRLKATAPETVRSNRLDVCVPATGASDCGALPADDLTRSIHPAKEAPGEEPTKETSHEEAPASKTPPTEQPLGGGGQSGGGVSAARYTAAAATLRVSGLLLTPLDDRAPGLIFRGRWRRVSEAGAWQRTLTLGSPGATLSVALPAGRPVFILRDVRHAARVTLLLGTRREVITIRPSASQSSRAIVFPRRAVAGTVKLRVLKGTLPLDGVAVAP